MDERKLAEMFNGAVPDVPPPTFDYDDVTAESGRQRVRRRNALMGGSVLGIVLLAGATVLGVALWKGTDAGSPNSDTAAPAAAGGSGSGGNGEAPLNETTGEGAKPRAEQDTNVPPSLPKQGGTSGGQPAPPGAGSTSSGCGQADAELAAALAGELPSAAPSERLLADIPCPAGARGVALRVDGGIISFVVAPAGTQFASPVDGQPDGTVVRVASTPDGRHVLLVSEPPMYETNAPHEFDLQGIADRLAASARF